MRNGDGSTNSGNLREKKKVFSKDWESPSDPDARIAKRKDDRTHLAYKAEHTIDLESDFLRDASAYHADEGDTKMLTRSLTSAQQNLEAAGIYRDIDEVASDKGYHANETLVLCHKLCCGLDGVITYIPDPEFLGSTADQAAWPGGY